MKAAARHVFCLIFASLLAPAAAGAVPVIEEARLENGLRILLMEAHNVPMVSMRLVMPAGSRFEPNEKGGIASLLATMLTDHTAQHDYQAWAKHLDSEAIRLGGGAGRDGRNLSLTVLKEALPVGLSAFAEALLQPGWDTKRFGSIKEDAIAAAKKAQEEPGVRAAEASAELLFAKHPYGHRPSGSMESLKRIALTDLKALYRRQCKPVGAVLAVSGDITMAELVKRIGPLFSGWTGAPQTARHELAAPRPVRGENRTITMETTQSLVQFVRLGPARNSADFFPVFVLNHMLGGGGFSSRLMSEVREKRGLVYGIYSYFMPLTVPGPFVITLQTRADQAGQAEAVAQQVMQQMHDGSIGRKQLHDAKANLVGGFAQRIDSNRERVGLISMIGFYGLPLDYLQVWTAKVESVTLDEVKQAARRYLNPAHWSLIQVGPQQQKG